MRARCLAILLLGAMAGAAPAVRAQHACDLIRDLPADHAVAPSFGPGATSDEGPLVITIIGRHAELEAALCAPEMRKLLDGNALCVSMPAPVPALEPIAAGARATRPGTAGATHTAGAADASASDLMGPGLVAWSGRKPAALHWNERIDGPLFAWVAGVVSGEISELDLPERSELGGGSSDTPFGPMPTLFARMAQGENADDVMADMLTSVEALLRCFTVASLLYGAGDHERALAGAQLVWEGSQGNPVGAGLRATVLPRLLSELLAVDPQRTRDVLDAKLKQALASLDAGMLGWLSMSDVLTLCTLLEQPHVFAEQVLQLAQGKAVPPGALDASRDGGFDLLCGAGRFDAARLLVGKAVAPFLQERFADFTSRGSLMPWQAAARATLPVDNPGAREEFGARCMRVALAGDEDADTNAVVRILKEEFGAKGLLIAVRAWRETGPAGEYSRRWGRRLLAGDDATPLLAPDERAALERWLAE